MPKSEAKEERVLLLVYLLVEVHVVDPSINWVLLGSDGAHIQGRFELIEGPSGTRNFDIKIDEF